jgi:hypothetical protein
MLRYLVIPFCFLFQMGHTKHKKQDRSKDKSDDDSRYRHRARRRSSSSENSSSSNEEEYREKKGSTKGKTMEQIELERQEIQEEKR